MLITFLIILAPLLILVRPLQKNAFFVLYFALMILSAYITENCYFRVIALSHKAFLVFVVYHLACINTVTLMAYAADKRAAIRGTWRVPEANLHTLEFLGGWIGAFVGQKIFRHKTKKKSYRIMFWLMLILQLVAVYLILHYLKLIHF
ncbi:MAG: DUF1294 domain-containing protein [Alphaproteobacteria bacterium]|nr:DUF1294 domain-containing protein [Alphaproteobacteria bacterium]